MRVQIYLGLEKEPQELLRELVRLGYVQRKQVLEPTDVALRGYILDVFVWNFMDPIRVEFLDTGVVGRITSFDAYTGLEIEAHNAFYILPAGGLSTRKLSAKRKKPRGPFISDFLDIMPNDLVVHQKYGIGRYLGVKRLNVGMRLSDCMCIEYAESEMLYVPFSDMELVSKYIGVEGSRPRLDKLGGTRWKNAKKTATEGAMFFAVELLKVEAERKSKKRLPFKSEPDWEEAFAKSFPYQETTEQIGAIHALKVRMESESVMDMLLCGDSGVGKTEVALRAAFKAVLSGVQVAFLVPTTVLAEQHYRNFIKRFEKYPVNIKMLSRFVSKKQRLGNR